MKLFEKNNILIVRLSSIGDVILTTPIIAAVAAAFPNANIDFLCSNNIAQLLDFNPNLKNVWQYDKNSSQSELLNLKNLMIENFPMRKYDLVIDLQNNMRSRRFLKSIYIEKFKLNKNRLYKIVLVHCKKQIKEARHIVDRYFDTISSLVPKTERGLEIWLKTDMIDISNRKQSDTLRIGIAAAAHHHTKQWLPEYFAELANLIAKKYVVELFFFGGKEDIGVTKGIIANLVQNAIDYTGKLSLLDTTAMVAEVDLMISNDSALMHIAAARKIPVLAIFGSTVPELGFGPYKVINEIAQVQLNCRPCTHIGRSSCPKGHFNCMKQLLPSEVFIKFEQLVQKSNLKISEKH